MARSINHAAHQCVREDILRRWRLEAQLEQLLIERERINSRMEHRAEQLRQQIARLRNKQIANRYDMPVASVYIIERDAGMGPANTRG